jgi:hypothetical protein
MAKETVFPRTSLRVYQTARSHILEGRYLHHCSTQKSHNHSVLPRKNHAISLIIVFCECNILVVLEVKNLAVSTAAGQYGLAMSVLLLVVMWIWLFSICCAEIKCWLIFCFYGSVLFIADRTNLVSTPDCIEPCPIVIETNLLRIIAGD